MQPCLCALLMTLVMINPTLAMNLSHLNQSFLKTSAKETVFKKRIYDEEADRLQADFSFDVLNNIFLEGKYYQTRDGHQFVIDEHGYRFIFIAEDLFDAVQISKTDIFKVLHQEVLKVTKKLKSDELGSKLEVAYIAGMILSHDLKKKHLFFITQYSVAKYTQLLLHEKAYLKKREAHFAASIFDKYEDYQPSDKTDTQPATIIEATYIPDAEGYEEDSDGELSPFSSLTSSSSAPTLRRRADRLLEQAQKDHAISPSIEPVSKSAPSSPKLPTNRQKKLGHNLSATQHKKTKSSFGDLIDKTRNFASSAPNSNALRSPRKTSQKKS